MFYGQSNEITDDGNPITTIYSCNWLFIDGDEKFNRFVKLNNGSLETVAVPQVIYDIFNWFKKDNQEFAKSVVIRWRCIWAYLQYRKIDSLSLQSQRPILKNATIWDFYEIDLTCPIEIKGLKVMFRLYHDPLAISVGVNGPRFQMNGWTAEIVKT